MFYSFEWGREKSIDWLKAFLLSFAESVVLIQPLKVKLHYFLPYFTDLCTCKGK